MAKHVLEGRGHPVFYYGSAYGGSLEPHYLTLVFAVLGPTFTAYRIGMGILVLATIAGVYWIARRAFGPLAAVVAAAYLTVPPFFFLYKGLTSDGHYNAFNLFVVLTLLVCLGIETAWQKARDPSLLFAALGVALGIGWWINPITPPISAAAVAWLVLRRRPRPRLRDALLAAAGFVVGSAPWTIWNARHGWASVTTPELAAVSVRGALHNLAEIARFSLATLAGGARFRIAGTWDTFPFSRIVVLAALAIFLAPTLERAIRGDRVARLLWLTFAVLVATVIWSSRYVPHEPRVLFPYYVLVPPLVGAGFVAWLGRRRALAFGLAGALLLFHARSLAVEYRHVRNNPTEATASFAPLLQALEREGLDRVYTDYWTAYRLSFESGEQIIAAPIPGEEAVRYPRYQTEVARAPDGIVIRSPRDACLETYLQEEGVPHRRIRVPPFSIFSGLPSSVFRFVEEYKALPLPRAAFRPSWSVGPQPARIPPGGTAIGIVSVGNVSPCAWPHAVHLGYHWRPLDPGLPYVLDGGRHVPDRRIEPGEGVTLRVEIRAPQAAGRYLLEYDMVFEGVTWFAPRGSAPAVVPMEVR